MVDFGLKIGDVLFSCPKVLMTFIPVILSWALSLMEENASCESRNASCNLLPRTLAMTAKKGSGNRAMIVNRQSIKRTIAMMVAPPEMKESARSRSLPLPHFGWHSSHWWHGPSNHLSDAFDKTTDPSL